MASVQLVNNEVGTVQPLAEVARLVRRRAPHAVLHTDAVQAAPWYDVAQLARRRRHGEHQRPQVRRPAGGRGSRLPPSREARTALLRRGLRNGSDGPARTTSPGIVGHGGGPGQRCAATGSRLRVVSRRLRDKLLAGFAGRASLRPQETARRPGKAPGHCHLRDRRGRERGSARAPGRLWSGGVGRLRVRQRGDGAQPRPHRPWATALSRRSARCA